MRKIILALLLTASILACKKDSSNTPESSSVVTPTQNLALIGRWNCDSFQINGGAVDYYCCGSADSIFFSTTNIIQSNYISGSLSNSITGQWHTVGDSLYALNDYYYNVTGDKLYLYLNSANKVKYWYHKR